MSGQNVEFNFGDLVALQIEGDFRARSYSRSCVDLQKECPDKLEATNTTQINTISFFKLS